MRRYVGMLALAIAFAVPVAGDARADSESRSVTTTTTTTRQPMGRVVITDMQTRRFRLGEDTRVYIAPDDVDLATLSGKDVKVFIDDSGRVSRMTQTTETTTIEDD